MAQKKHYSPQRITAHYLYGDQDFEHFVGEGIKDTVTKFIEGVSPEKVSSVTLDLHLKDIQDVDKLQRDLTNLRYILKG